MPGATSVRRPRTAPCFEDCFAAHRDLFPARRAVGAIQAGSCPRRAQTCEMRKERRREDLRRGVRGKYYRECIKGGGPFRRPVENRRGAAASSENDAEPADGALAAHLHLLAARVLDRRGEGLVLDVEADVPEAELDARHALVGRA